MVEAETDLGQLRLVDCSGGRGRGFETCVPVHGKVAERVKDGEEAREGKAGLGFVGKDRRPKKKNGMPGW